MLGVTRQRVSQIISSYEDFPAPEVELSGGRVWSRAAVETWIAAHPDRGRKATTPSEGLFPRFTDHGRSAVGQAQQEARRLNHNYIGTEHLLLGLLGIDEGIARTALRVAGVALDDLRQRIEAKVGRGSEPAHGHIPFTKRAMEALEHAKTEADALGTFYVGTEQVLLGLLVDRNNLACEVLREAPVDLDALRRSVVEMSKSFGRHDATDQKTTLHCSFCGKSQKSVKKLIAGPNVFICDECVALCDEILEAEAAPPETDAEPDDVLKAVLARLVRLEERMDTLGSDQA